MIHIGSIAALYLGPQDQPVTGHTPPDPEADERADYARAKAMTDRMLLALHGRDVCVLRPGLVVGEGGLPFHSGLGVFNNEQHCIGWNAGRNPLPFVLVEDVAEAILRAGTRRRIDGRCYNLVGDVRPSAREYIADAGRGAATAAALPSANGRFATWRRNTQSTSSSASPAAAVPHRAGAICCPAA